MSSISSIPTNRVSSQLAAQQLINQMQANEASLQTLETQVSTGQKLTEPSDDPNAALQAIGLQEVINQKNQVSTNITSAQAYLNETGTALESAANLVASAQAEGLSVSGTTASDPSQLQAISAEIGSALQQLVAIGNQSFDGRYLFSGSTTGVQPFNSVGQNIEYTGNAGTVSTYSDIGQLFQSNVSGAEAFGALSNTVTGTADLAPALSASTNLATLNGGTGISPGSIQISDGKNTSVVDLSHVATLGDVAAAIEANPPAGDTVGVQITSTGLAISLNAPNGGNLSISEVGSGDTAAQLGILMPVNGHSTVSGTALQPTLSSTTPLKDLLGTQAQADVVSGNGDANFVVQANSNGSAYDGYTVNLVANPNVTAGNESVAVDSSAKTITVGIAAGSSTANNVIAALNGNAAFSANFTASLDPTELDDTGAGDVAASATAATTGGSGVALDQSSGVQIVNGGQTYTVNFTGDQTVGDLLNSLNGSAAGVLAQVNAAGTGFNITSRISGGSLSIGENGGQTATQLGIRTFAGSTPLSQLNNGTGVTASTSGPDFAIQLPDGTKLQISVGSATTVQDVINLINNNGGNQGPGDQVVAGLAADGNGITLTSTDTSTTTPFAVTAENGSQAAQQLGLIPSGASQSSAATTAGGVQTIAGSDVNPQQGDSLFTALINLQNAVQTGNTGGISSALTMLGTATQQLQYAQAEVGTRQQSLSDIQSSISTQQDDLQASLSNDTDTDMATAITTLTQTQAAYQATLQMAGQLSQLTLMSFLPL